jgi:hypothetical protein
MALDPPRAHPTEPATDDDDLRAGGLRMPVPAPLAGHQLDKQLMK